MNPEFQFEETVMHYLSEGVPSQWSPGDRLFACDAQRGAATTDDKIVTCEACKKAAKITGLVEDGSE